MQQHRTGPETDRLCHRAFNVDDAEAFFALNSNADVMRFTGEPLLTSLEESREAIANYRDFDEVGFGRWACVLKQTQSVIGFCGLKYLSDLEVVDVGYRFLPQYWGHGLATEACRASLDFGFSVLNLDRIVGLVVPENVASIRVLEKTGMRPDGDFVYDGVFVLRYCRERATSANSLS